VAAGNARLTSVPDLEERVAALEELVLHPQLFATFPSELTEEEEARFREEFTVAASLPYRILPSVPPLTPDQVRYLLRECVTAVKPGEHLILRIPWTVTPTQVRELQDFVTRTAEWLDLQFKVLVLPGDSLAIAEPEPDFMSEVRAEAFIGTRSQGEAIRPTHEPTRVTVEAPTRAEAPGAA
jgi:hypothetical protein